ncbi:MAG: hypothetical protein N4A39_17825 [Roseicyclus sp.]|nr:hypothetical protein [Roseicyclus sp.]
MTAEIAILNRSGVALAADSAVTVGKERVWKSSNKLFHLAPHDLAIMLYGTDQHIGIPWETIVKEYRKTLGSKSFETVSDCCKDILSFLDGIESGKADEKDSNTIELFLAVISLAKDAVSDVDGKVKRRKALKAACDAMGDEYGGQAKALHFDYSEFEVRYGEAIEGLAEEDAGFYISKPVLGALKKACYRALIAPVSTDFSTGLIVAGFGTKQLFPCLSEYIIDGNVDGATRAWRLRHENLNDDGVNGKIIPFGQMDMANVFMEGISPVYRSGFENILEGALKEQTERLIGTFTPASEIVVERHIQSVRISKMLESFRSQLDRVTSRTFVSPILRVVQSLPKEEMAALAEALVETTSMRRRMDSDVETVGGPVDVAVVSKADGFIWMKRKHYFDASLNPDFMGRRKWNNGE